MAAKGLQEIRDKEAKAEEDRLKKENEGDRAKIKDQIDLCLQKKK